MSKIDVIRPAFVEAIPASPQRGVLYISKKYRTAVHLCCCGCGLKVVTPLKPQQWSLIVHAGNVSLYPSIGNWSFPCKSHYWIKENRIAWSGQFSGAQIAAVRQRDLKDKEQYFEARRSRSLLQRIWDWLK